MFVGVAADGVIVNGREVGRCSAGPSSVSVPATVMLVPPSKLDDGPRGWSTWKRQVW